MTSSFPDSLDTETNQKESVCEMLRGRFLDEIERLDVSPQEMVIMGLTREKRHDVPVQTLREAIAFEEGQIVEAAALAPNEEICLGNGLDVSLHVPHIALRNFLRGESFRNLHQQQAEIMRRLKSNAKLKEILEETIGNPGRFTRTFYGLKMYVESYLLVRSTVEKIFRGWVAKKIIETSNTHIQSEYDEEDLRPAGSITVGQDGTVSEDVTANQRILYAAVATPKGESGADAYGNIALFLDAVKIDPRRMLFIAGDSSEIAYAHAIDDEDQDIIPEDKTIAVVNEDLMKSYIIDPEDIITVRAMLNLRDRYNKSVYARAKQEQCEVNPNDLIQLDTKYIEAVILLENEFDLSMVKGITITINTMDEYIQLQESDIFESLYKDESFRTMTRVVFADDSIPEEIKDNILQKFPQHERRASKQDQYQYMGEQQLSLAA